MSVLTIHLSVLNFLKESLEPSKRRCITADPEKLDTGECTQIASLLAVPDVLQDGCKRSDTDTGSDKNGDLDIENVLSRCTVGTINADHGHGAVRCSGVELHEVATGGCGRLEGRLVLDVAELLIILDLTLHRSLGKRSDDGWAGANTLAEGLRPVTDLTNVHRDVRVLGRRRDGKLRDV